MGDVLNGALHKAVREKEDTRPQRLNSLYRQEVLTAEVDIGDYLAACVDVPKFLAYCRECNNYNRRWACPPFDFDPAAVWRRYRSLYVEGRVFYPRPGVSTEQFMKAFYQAKDQTLADVLQLEAEREGSYALPAGSCYICPGDCAKAEGKPCRFPDKLRYSIEALGGDVAKTAEVYLHKPMLWIKNDEMPEYLMLVLGLLLP